MDSLFTLLDFSYDLVLPNKLSAKMIKKHLSNDYLPISLENSILRIFLLFLICNYQLRYHVIYLEKHFLSMLNGQIFLLYSN